MNGSKPLLEIFTVCWNESKILPDFIKWYRDRISDCLITVYDNNSDDNTFGIALDNECKVIPFDTGGYMDEQTLMDIRNNCWKESKAKWCLVVDCDELVEVNTKLLQEEYFTDVFHCEGYEMFGTEEDIVETLTQGCKSAGYCKPVLFQPERLVEINLAPGSHSANPITKEGAPVCWTKGKVNMYHTKWRSWTNGIERARLLAKRRSEHSKQMGWNFHYELDESIHLDYYTNGIKNRVKVR
jgi:hypothetical protein